MAKGQVTEELSAKMNSEVQRVQADSLFQEEAVMISAVMSNAEKRAEARESVPIRPLKAVSLQVLAH